VLDPIRRPRVLDAAGQTLGDAEPTLDLGQHQHAAVGGQTAGVEGDLDWLAAHGRQAGQKWGIIGHGGRELRWSRRVGFTTRILHDLNGLVSARQPS